MNPRVSRSSALASKATGFPIAKIAAKLAIGYTLDEIKNDITRETPACFEPTIDYCVVKVPRFTFEKFPQADATLTTRMKSVGEAMAIGRTFKEALQKALRSLEIKRFGLCGDGVDRFVDPESLRLKLSTPNSDRVFYLAQAFRDGMSIDEVFDLTKIDKWFLRNVEQIVAEAHRRLGCQPDSAGGLSACPSMLQQAGSLPSKSAKMADLRFHGFDEYAEIKMTRRHLPHWEQPGATYFATFRLADAIASDVLAEWREERALWLNHHPHPWDWKTACEYMQRFEEEREQWLDQGQGSCLLRDSRAQKIVRDSLEHFDRDRYVIDACVVMPNHVHVIVKPLGTNSLNAILHSWKSYTSNQINRLINQTGPLWMAETFDTIVRDWNHLAACRDYIEHNPAKAGLSDDQFVMERRDVLVPRDSQREAGQAGSLPAESGWQPYIQRKEFLRAKKLGFSDRQVAIALNTSENEIREKRKTAGVIPTYRLVDTCAAEFEAYTPYYYSTYGDENERRESGKRKIIILGGGPNRIGQGIEFDYCCVHAAFALRELRSEERRVGKESRSQGGADEW